ncbi:MAG: STAS domain-containing protein [Thermodesulfobacteriota bacterium]
MFEVIIRPRGDLIDFQAWENFAEVLSRVVNLDCPRIAIDLAEVNRVSSNYIGSIISTYKTAEDQGRKMILVNVQPKLYELLEMLKLTEMMTVVRA